MIEMRGNGETRLKIYPFILNPGELCRDNFSDKICNVMKKAEKTFVTFAPDMSRTMNFCINVQSRKELRDYGLEMLLENDKFGMIFDKIIRDYKIRYIALREDEFNQGNINKINIYY